MIRSLNQVSIFDHRSSLVDFWHVFALRMVAGQSVNPHGIIITHFLGLQLLILLGITPALMLIVV